MYHTLTDTDSTSLQFLFVSDPTSNIPDTKYQEIIFEVICTSEISERFDKSHEFWEKFGIQNPHLRKFLSYFSVENIDNPCHLTIACNPKEYF